MARRKIKFAKNVVTTPIGGDLTQDVWCPMASGSENKSCYRHCAWFSIVGDSAFCKEAEIGGFDEADDN